MYIVRIVSAHCTSLTSVGRVEGVCRSNLLVVGRQPGLVDELVVVDALDGVPEDGLHNDDKDLKHNDGEDEDDPISSDT